MDMPEFISILLKILLATGAYLAVLGLGVLAAWWMGRRPRRSGGNHD